MKKEDLKIEVVPVPLSDSFSLDPANGLSPPKSRSVQSWKNKQSESVNSKDQYEARHMFYTKSGRTIVAFERGSSALQAKKRLFRLLL